MRRGFLVSAQPYRTRPVTFQNQFAAESEKPTSSAQINAINIPREQTGLMPLAAVPCWFQWISRPLVALARTPLGTSLAGYGLKPILETEGSYDHSQNLHSAADPCGTARVVKHRLPLVHVAGAEPGTLGGPDSGQPVLSDRKSVVRERV